MSDSRANPVTNFIAGGCGGVCLVASGHPFDLVKVRLQTAPRPKPGEKPMFTGMVDCFGKTIRKEGLFAIYKGMGAPLIGVVPMSSLFFFGSAIGKKIQRKEPGHQFTVWETFQAGCFAGVLTTTVMVPGERVKCLLQIQQNTAGSAEGAKYKGPIDCAKQLYKAGGIKSIYRGTGATLLRDVPASGLYLGGYEFLLRTMAGDDRTQLSPLATLVAGGMAGVANWGWAIMPDVLKSRLQTAPDGTYPNGIRDVFRDMMAHEGPRALFKGIVPVLIRSFPANACMFMGYELSMKAFNMMGF